MTKLFKKIIIFIAKVYIAICTVLFTVRLILGLAFLDPIEFRTDFMEKSACRDIDGMWYQDKQVCGRQPQIRQK
jgi:hypothetical protein